LGRANILQCFFAQSIGIAFTGFGKRDELVGDGLPNVIGAVPDPQSDAGHLESEPEGAPRLLVQPLAVKELGDGHGAPPSSRRERDRSLSHRRLGEPLSMIAQLRTMARKGVSGSIQTGLVFFQVEPIPSRWVVTGVQ
jgi:hypothetical protein